MCIKKLLRGLALCMAGLVLLPAVVAAQTTWTSSKIEKYNGYDYELWNQDNKGSVSMTLTGDNGSGANAKGGTFTAQWSGTCNVLFRSGKKWGANSTQNHTQIGQMTVDFAASWSSNDDVKYLGLYGWAYFTQANTPSNFSNQIEWYIIQDRGSYNPCSAQNGTKKGSGTINGISYDFMVCDRMNQPMLTGNGNFKQFFSIPTSGGRTSGTVDVSAHFKAWHAAGMYMDGPLYEVAMKIESYKCSGSNGQGSGSGSVTKNILTIGGTTQPGSSSSSARSSSSSARSSSSVAGGTSSSSSGSAPVQATNCNNFIGTLPASPNPPANPYTACFRHTNNKCYVCKIENESDGNTCSSTWVWNGDYVEDNLTSNYWYREVTCPTGTSSSSATGSSSSSSSAETSESSSSSEDTSPIAPQTPYPKPHTLIYYTLKGEPVGSTKPSKSGVYLVKEGNLVRKIVVR